MWCILLLVLAVSSYIMYVDSSALYSFSSAASASAAASQSSRQKRNNVSEPWKNPNLPNTIEPILYKLYIYSYMLNNGTLFNGNVSIDVNVINQTKTIIVHKKKLKLGDWRAYHTNGTEIGVTGHFDFLENDYYVMETRNFLPRRARLVFLFTGNMSLVTGSDFEDSGLYKTPYVNDAGQESWLMVSDFGYGNARSVFPCFDEPRFKAQFKITISHANSFTALSNMAVESRRPDGADCDTFFKLSPRMSSYLLGFAVTNFRSKNRTVNGKQLRVWAQPNRLDQINKAIAVTPSILNYLHRELNLTYSPEKLDQLAVPGELLNNNEHKNWGLLTYKESTFLVDAKKDGDLAKYEALVLVAHTLVHNHFGNHATCRYFWGNCLNEALATFYEVRALTAAEPTLFHKEYLFGWKLESLMKSDSNILFDSDHDPLYVDTNKAAAILRMVENFVGADTFKRGIRQYFTRNANGTVVADSLWLALQQPVGSRFNIKLIVTNWMEKRGFPVINVKLLNGSRIKATQKRFLEDPLEVSDQSYKWFVPLTYRAKGKTQQVVWMNKTDVSFEISLQSIDDWIEFNCDRTGYYRVNYDANLWERIRKQLNENHTVFSQLSRSAMLADAAALVKAEQLDYVTFLNLIRYASKEKDLVPWLHEYMYDVFDDVLRMLNATLTRSFQNYMLRVTKNLMDKLQVKDEGTYIEKQLRPKIMTIACNAGHKGCIDNTTRVFKAWIKNETKNAIPKNIQEQVYCLGLAFSKVESEWNTTLERFKRAKTYDEAKVLRRALTCSRNSTMLERLLDLSIVDESISIIVATHIAHKPTSGRLPWTWLKRKFAVILEEIGDDVEELVVYTTVHFNTRADHQEVLEFFEVHRDISEYAKNDTLDTINRNIRWMDRNIGPITTWLKRHARS